MRETSTVRFNILLHMLNLRREPSRKGERFSANLKVFIDWFPTISLPPIGSNRDVLSNNWLVHYDHAIYLVFCSGQAVMKAGNGTGDEDLYIKYRRK